MKLHTIQHLPELSVVTKAEGTMFVSLCPELDIASQGSSIGEARVNLREAVELFFETADASEIQSRLQSEI